MKTTRKRTWIVLWFLPVVLSCNLVSKIKETAEKAAQPTTIKNAASNVQITLPPGWKEEKRLNDIAILQGANRLKAMFVVVIQEPKTDFDEDATLDDYTALSRKSIETAVTEATFSDAVPAFGATYPAKEFTVECIVEKTKIKYLCTTVETANHFYQVLTWTQPSKFTENEHEMRSVTQSLKELGNDATQTTP